MSSMLAPPVTNNQDTQTILPDTQNEDTSLEAAKNDILAIIREIDKQERPTREIQIKIWKYLDLLWTGIANFYWNSVSNQWQPITYDDIRHLSESADIDPTLLNKTVNMIRPYGETIVGALTTSLPRNKYYPSDADSIDDINTAKAYINIERKIARDNEMKVKVVQMIVNLLTGGFFGAYNYSHSSEKYGTVTRPEFQDQKFRISNFSCSECGAEISQSKVPDISSDDQAKGTELGMDETINENFERVENQEDALGQQQEEQIESQIEAMTCPECQALTQPMIDTSFITESVQTGVSITPKARQIIEIYGPMQVKIPTHASKKEEVLWCILEDEVHESLMRSLYPQYRDMIKPGSHTDLAYDRWARSQYENMGELNQYYVTRRRLWLRPSAYEILGKEETAENLEKLFPTGLLAVFSSDRLLYIEEADIDDCWTFSLNPIYRRLYGDPLLKAAIPLQEVSNDLFQLEVETVRYAVPQVFADPEYFDFETYQKTKAQPGLIYPMKTAPGKNLQDNLAETRTATLPNEVGVLEQKIEQLFQFILGVFPSVSGGSGGGSKTLGEYEQSRGQALQRLNINPWEIVNTAYAELMAKAVKGYADDLLEDEAYVESKGTSFVNTWIKKADLQGRIGEVKPELSDQFPTSWGQKKAAWLELIGLNNEVITQTLFHPENIGLITQILSIDDLYVPGDDQRNKQLEEIRVLISSEPMLGPGMTDQGMIDPNSPPVPVGSSVPIESVDDNDIHIQVLSAFICSAVGQALKENNPMAYQNLMLHLQEHQIAQQQQMMAQMQMQQAQQMIAEGPGSGGNQKEAPSKNVKESR